jgi:pimeloyl-ACP methyl ester carboxylesterase
MATINAVGAPAGADCRGVNSDHDISTLSRARGTSNLSGSLRLMRKLQRVEAKYGRTITVDGGPVHVLEAGDKAGPPVLMLHGCGSLAEEVMSPFSNMALHIIAPDRPGFGFSGALGQTQRGPLAQSYWLEHLAAALKIDRVILVGHSIGCAPAILLADRRPDIVKSLLLMAPFCRPTPEQKMLLLRLATAPGIGPFFSRHVVYRFADYFGRRVIRAAMHPNPVPAHLLEFPYHHAARHQALRTMADELLQFNADMASFAGRVDCPTYVIHGAEDQTAKASWHLPWLTERVPNVDVRLLQGVGHNPHHAEPAIACTLLQKAANSYLGTIQTSIGLTSHGGAAGARLPKSPILATLEKG